MLMGLGMLQTPVLASDIDSLWNIAHTQEADTPRMRAIFTLLNNRRIPITPDTLDYLVRLAKTVGGYPKDTAWAGHIYQNQGSAFLKLGMQDSAFRYWRMAKRSFLHQKQEKFYLNALYILQFNSNRVGDTAMARAYYEELIRFGKQIQDPKLLVKGYADLGAFYIK
jgi:tetratricopeptide (TPR) repeat protein